MSVQLVRVVSGIQNPLVAATSVMSSSVVGGANPFSPLENIAVGAFPEADPAVIQAFEVRLCETLQQSAVPALLKKPEVVDLVSATVHEVTQHLDDGISARRKLNQSLHMLEEALFPPVAELQGSAVKLEFVLSNNAKKASLIVSAHVEGSKALVVEAFQGLVVRANRREQAPDDGALHDRVARINLRLHQDGLDEDGLDGVVVRVHGERFKDDDDGDALIDTRGMDDSSGQDEVVLPSERPRRSRIGRFLGQDTQLDKVQDRDTQEIRLRDKLEALESYEPSQFSTQEFHEYVQEVLRRNGFKITGRDGWIRFDNNRNGEPQPHHSDPRQLFKLFIKPKSAHFFDVLKRVLHAIRDEEGMQGKLWANPQAARVADRGSDPYGSSHEPTFLLYFYGSDADFELARISYLITRYFSPNELDEFGIQSDTRDDWDEVGLGGVSDSDVMDVRGFSRSGRTRDIQVGRKRVSQRGPSFARAVNGILFWNQGGFGESERRAIASRFSHQATLRRQSLADEFDGLNFHKYKGYPDPFLALERDRRILLEVQLGERLLHTHSTSYLNVAPIARDQFRTGTHGNLWFQYGINFSYSKEGAPVVFVMRKDFKVDHPLRDDWRLRVEGETDEEFKKRILQNLVLLSDVRTKSYLDANGEEEGDRDDAAGKTVMLTRFEDDKIDKPLFAGHFPHLELFEDVDLDEVIAVLVPEHIYEEVLAGVRRTPLASRIRKVEGTGATEEEFLSGVSNMPRRTRWFAGQFQPVVGFKAAHRMFMAYLHVVLAETQDQG